MATKSIEHLSEPRVVEFVTAARVARMATADHSLAPHAIPICFWFDGAQFYFAIDEKPKRAVGTALKRMRNIADNPRVALIIDHYEEDWSQLAYVLVHGVARLVEDSEEYMLALRHLRDKYRQYRAMELYPDRNPVVRIEPERVHVWGARFGAPAAAGGRAR
jgi:PPOX class probable F420-dependent enzyme